MSDLITYKANEDEVQLSPAIVRKSLVRGSGNVSDQEVNMFLQLCKYQRLNPWLNEAYLVKYGDKYPATIVVGKEAYFKRAETHDQYDGIESGLHVEDEEGNLRDRPGAFFRPNDTLLGAWAKVWRKDRGHPSEVHVRLEEYEGRKGNGELNGQWASKPATMILKVAEVQALRKAFPEQIGALYDEVESHTVTGESPAEPRDVTPDEAPLESKLAEYLEEIENLRRMGALTDGDVEYCKQFLSVAKNVPHLEQGWEKLKPHISKKVEAWKATHSDAPTDETEESVEEVQGELMNDTIPEDIY